MKDNVVMSKSKAFALKIVKVYRHLNENNKEFVMSKQLLRSGTSIGANVYEAVRGVSKADFYNKLNIALKEANETVYWLELLHESEYLNNDVFTAVYAECQEIIKILVSITKNQKLENPQPVSN